MHTTLTCCAVCGALLKDRGSNLVRLEADISKLERDKAMEMEKLNHIETTMQSVAIKAELGPNKVSNISIAEQPTPPMRDMKGHVMLLAGIAGGGLALGLGLAFSLGKGGGERRQVAVQ